MAPLIEIDDVSRVFGGGTAHPVVAVEDFSLDIGESEFVTIVGRSGCGKSTLLRMVAGLLSPTEGEIRIHGEVVKGARRDLSFVFQRASLFPWRTVLDNVMLPVEILGLDRKKYEQRAKELLELVGLEGFEDLRPDALSGGMQQRAALCRSLLYEPDVLLMDEPFAALDALTREEMGLELQRLWSQYRKTILFVTHSIDEAVLLADRIVVMTPRPGRLARIVDIELPRPRSLRDVDMARPIAEYGETVRELLFSEREDMLAGEGMRSSA